MTSIYEQLRRRGWHLSIYVGVHKTAKDPLRCYFLAPRIEGGYRPGDKPADLLRFATAAEVSRFLDETEAGIKPDTCAQPLWMIAQNNGLHFAPHKNLTMQKDGPDEQRFYVCRKVTGPDDKLTPQDVLVKYATESECRKAIEDFRNARLS
jgi:hypothetical protein